MGLLFEKDEKSLAEPYRTIQFLLSILSLMLIILILFGDFNVSLLRSLLVVYGLLSFTEGMERFIAGKKQERFLISFGFAFLWFTAAFFISNIISQLFN